MLPHSAAICLPDRELGACLQAVSSWVTWDIGGNEDAGKIISCAPDLENYIELGESEWWTHA